MSLSGQTQACCAQAQSAITQLPIHEKPRFGAGKGAVLTSLQISKGSPKAEDAESPVQTETHGQRHQGGPFSPAWGVK